MVEIWQMWGLSWRTWGLRCRAAVAEVKVVEVVAKMEVECVRLNVKTTLSVT